MDIIIDIVFFLGGSIIGAFTVGQSILILRSGLPTAISWYHRRWLTAPTPIFRYISWCIILLLLFALITYLVPKYFESHVPAYFIGVGIAFLYALAKSGKSTDNIADFVQFNIQYINHREMDQFFKELGIDDSLFTGKSNDNGKSA